MTLEEKKKLAAPAIAALDKTYGKGSVINLSEKPQVDLDVISTGSIGLDTALGVGGLPKGRIVEIYGPESSGKTTLAIHIMCEAQKLGGLCAVVDAEHAFDADYAAAIGVDIDNLYINQPSSGEEGLEVVDKLAGSGAYDVIVIDSVAALTPQAELDGEMGESKIGLHARLMSQAMRKLVATVFKNNVLVIFINQLREKIGVMFGNPETTTGGNALKFYASVRLDVRRSTTTQNSIMNGEEKIGNQTTVKIIKNKVAPPFKKAEFDILYGLGIDRVGEIVKLCSANGTLKKWGQQITFQDTKYTLGDFATLINDNPEFYNMLKASCEHKV